MDGGDEVVCFEIMEQTVTRWDSREPALVEDQFIVSSEKMLQFSNLVGHLHCKGP